MRFNTIYVLLFTIFVTSLIGFRLRRQDGLIKKNTKLKIERLDFNGSLGSRATILQFSSSFCTQCRAAKSLISEVIKNQTDISYIEVDAESNLELVRRVGIRSTPTTLFLDKSGFEIARATGAPKRDQLIKVISAL